MGSVHCYGAVVLELLHQPTNNGGGGAGGGEGDGKGYGGEAGGREVSSLNCLTIKNTLTDPNRSAVTNKREVTFMVCIVCIFCLFKKKTLNPFLDFRKKGLGF